MKYIINISELKSSTYQSAADDLKRKGHKRRVSDLETWAEKRKQEENEILKKEMVDRIKSIGTFQIEISDSIFEFYIYFRFNPNRFKERYQEWIIGDIGSLYIELDIGVIPVLNDDESRDNLYSDLQKNYMYDLVTGLTWIGMIELHLGFMPSETEYFTNGIDFNNLYDIWKRNNYDHRIPKPINPKGSIYKENWDGVPWQLSSRREAVKFRKSLIDIFNGNVSYDDYSKNPGGLKGKVMDTLISDTDCIELDYFEEWIKSLSRINVNSLYKD